MQGIGRFMSLLNDLCTSLDHQTTVPCNIYETDVAIDR